MWGDSDPLERRRRVGKRIVTTLDELFRNPLLFRRPLGSDESKRYRPRSRTDIMHHRPAVAHRIGVVARHRQVVPVRLTSDSTHPGDGLGPARERDDRLAWLQLTRRDPAAIRCQPGVGSGGVDRLVRGVYWMWCWLRPAALVAGLSGYLFARRVVRPQRPHVYLPLGVLQNAREGIIGPQRPLCRALFVSQIAMQSALHLATPLEKPAPGEPS